MAWPRSFTHHSFYHISHLPIWVMHLNTFDVEHIIYVWNSFFNVNSMVVFVFVRFQGVPRCKHRVHQGCVSENLQVMDSHFQFIFLSSPSVAYITLFFPFTCL
jgi:hypothetical protein